MPCKGGGWELTPRWEAQFFLLDRAASLTTLFTGHYLPIWLSEGVCVSIWRQEVWLCSRNMSGKKHIREQHACCVTKPLYLHVWPTESADRQSKSWVCLFLFSDLLDAPYREQDASFELRDLMIASLHIEMLVTYLSLHVQVSRIRCSSWLLGSVSWTQMTGDALLLTPVSVSWGPTLIHFCPRALARNHAGKSMGCSMMSQTLFFLDRSTQSRRECPTGWSDLSANFYVSWQ